MSYRRYIPSIYLSYGLSGIYTRYIPCILKLGDPICSRIAAARRFWIARVFNAQAAQPKTWRRHWTSVGPGQPRTQRTQFAKSRHRGPSRK